MKKIKILACGSLLLCSGLMFAGCGEKPKDFDASKITVGSQSVVYNGEEQIFSVGYTGEDVNVTYAKNTAENFVGAADLDLENAGTYTIYYKLSKDGYNDYISTAQTFVISEKEITVTLPTITDFVANAKTNEQLVNEVLSKYTYNQSDLVGGDTLDLNVSLGNYNKTLADSGDEYVISATDNDSNYDITVVNGSYKLIDAVSIESAGTTTYYSSIENAILNAKDGDTIKLHKDIFTKNQIVVNKSITIDGQGKYIIYAQDNEFNSSSLISLAGEDKTLVLKDITINAQDEARAVYASAGKLKVDGATITRGKANNTDESQNYVGGVYITGTAEFEMTSGSIIGNSVGTNYVDDNYVEYTADLWIGSQASGKLSSINGGEIGSVFVNANEYSLEGSGFEINGGSIENVYVEHDKGNGANFTYTDGTVDNLFVSTLQSGEAVKVDLVKGRIYKGGVIAKAVVGGVETLFGMQDYTDGTVTNFLQNNANADITAYVDGNFLPMVLAIPQVNEVVLIRDVTLNQTLTINTSVVINGQNKYTIKAANNLNESGTKVSHMVHVTGSDMIAVEFKDVTLDGNYKCRVIRADAGKVVINGATITKGKANNEDESQNYIGGVYITGKAKFEMTSGSITGNSVGTSYVDDNYVEYSADLWIGSQANGKLSSINGGEIGSVFVNANEYSLEGSGFEINGGTIENVYVEYDGNHGANFTYTNGVVDNLYVSTLQSGVGAKVNPKKGTTYVGGLVAVATVESGDVLFDMEDFMGGYILEFLGENPNAYVKVYTDGDYLSTVLAIEQVDEIYLVRNVTLNSTLTISRTIVLNGFDRFTIQASDSFTDKELVSVKTEGAELTLKDIVLDGNNKTRVVYVSAGKLKVDGATITRGKANNTDESQNYIGGVYITGTAEFEMTSGSITGNSVGTSYVDDNYVEYSADLWIGSQASGKLSSINGGEIGNVFVNANEYSLEGSGFEINGGTIENVYVEYDRGNGANFTYTDGEVEHLYISTTTSGESNEVSTLVKGTTYIGGETY